MVDELALSIVNVTWSSGAAGVIGVTLDRSSSAVAVPAFVLSRRSVPRTFRPPAPVAAAVTERGATIWVNGRGQCR